MIDLHPISQQAIIENKEVGPIQYLKEYFRNELILLLHYSKLDICKTLELLLDQTDNILKTPNVKEWKFRPIFLMSLYYILAKICCDNIQDKDDSNEPINSIICDSIVRQSSIIFNNEMACFDGFLRVHFQNLLSSIGSHSSLIYDAFTNSILAHLSSKSFILYITPMLYIPRSISYVERTIDPFYNIVLQNLSEQNTIPYCDILRDTILNLCRKDIPGFITFLSSEHDIVKASLIYSQIDEWSKKKKSLNSSYLSAQFSLLVIMSSKNKFQEAVKEFVQKICGFKNFKPKSKAAALHTIFYIFEFLMLTHIQETFVSFIKPIYINYLEYCLEPRHNFSSNQNYVGFAIYIFMHEQDTFTNKILPLYISSKNYSILARIFLVICKQITQITLKNPKIPHLNVNSLRVFIPHCISLFEKAKADEQSNSYIKVFLKGFAIYPSIFKETVFESSAFLNNFIGILKLHSFFSEIKEPLLGFFDLSFIENTQHSEQFWKSTKIIFDFLLDYYKTKALYKPQIYSNGIAEVVLNATNFISCLFQNPLLKVVPQQYLQYIYDIIYDLEALSLMFFASSYKNYRDVAKVVMGIAVEIVDTSLPDLVFCVEVYRTLITDARKITALTPGHMCFKNSLRTLPTSSLGIEIAFDALYNYHLALTSSINPNIEQNSVQTITFLSKPQITEEWIGVSSILYSLITSKKQQLYASIVNLMSDSGDSGLYTVTTIPSSLHIHHFMPFITYLSQYIQSFKNDQNIFEHNEKTIHICKNIMKVFRGIVVQKYWETQMIAVDTFSEISLSFVVFCDNIPGDEFRILCSKSLSSMNKMLSEHECVLPSTVRNTIAKTLIGWLNLKSTKQAISSIIDAVASMLDNLNLLECIDSSLPKTPKEQASSLFMFYFVAIRSQLDHVSGESFEEIASALASLLKRNLNIGMNHCLSMGYSEKDDIRAVFISALASVFKVSEIKVVDSNIFQNISLFDILFEDNFQVLEYVSDLIPYSRAELFGTALLNAAIYKKCEEKLLAKMISIELNNIDESTKTTLFRGNSVSARIVTQYPRLIGTKWMSDFLKPIFLDVIKTCNAKGNIYNIERGTNIESNRENFKNLLYQFVDVIDDQSYKMPIGIMKEMKLLYEMVYEIYGDFAFQILNGFYFLRFMFPVFTIPNLIGLPKTIPEIPRVVFLQISSFLMTATLKGNLDDKGPNYQFFNEIAEYAHSKFMKMFHFIVESELPDSFPSIPVNEIVTRNTIHAELWPIQQQIVKGILEIENDNHLKESLEILLNKIQSLGQPKALVRTRCATMSKVDADPSSNLGTLLNMNFSKEQLQKLSGFLVHENHNANDGSSIIYLFMDKLNVVTDPTIVSYIIMKSLNDEQNKKVTLVLFLDSFDETKIPIVQEIKALSKMKPAYKISKFIFLEPNQAFANFVSRNPSLFDKPLRFYFLKELIEFNELLGPPSELIPESTIESLTKPYSVHVAFVNGKQRNVVLHQRSIQIIEDTVKQTEFEFTSTTIIMTKDIDKYTRYHSCSLKPNLQEFIIGTTKKLLFRFVQPLDSPLYDAILTLTQRNQILNNLQDKIKIDSSTLHWLMLNLVFINLININTSTFLKKAGIDLIYAVCSSFSFKHNIKVLKVQKEALPENLLGYVIQLSKDIADNNENFSKVFINEYFNAYVYLDEDIKKNSLFYLNPWIKNWIIDDDDNNFIEKFVDMYDKLENISIIFRDNVWIYFFKNEKAMLFLMSYLLNKEDEKMIEIFLSLSEIDSKTISFLLMKNFLNIYIKNKDRKIIYLLKVLTYLLSNHLFHSSFTPSLIYNVIIFQYILPESILTNLDDFYMNFIHFLINLIGNNDNNLDSSFYKALTIEVSESKLEDHNFFENWLSNTKLIGNTLNSIVTNKTLRNNLYSKFLINLDNLDKKIVCSFSLFYSAVFAPSCSDFLTDSLSFLERTKDDYYLPIICTCLSLFKNDADIPIQFYFGLCTALYTKDSLSIQLFLQAKYYMDQSKENIILPEYFNKLEECTLLSFHENLTYSVLTLFSVLISNDKHYEILEKLTKHDDKISKAFGYIFSEKEEDCIDYDFEFGELSESIAASLLLILKYYPKKGLIKYLNEWIFKTPDLFKSLNIMNMKDFQSSLSNIDLKLRFLLSIYHETKETRYALPTIITSKIQGNLSFIDKNSFYNLLQKIKPN